ncbi:MAG: hypothetical protein SchgKO_22650 [Schleiferiaceae bacterium]
MLTVMLIPMRLYLIRLELSLMRRIGIPTSWMHFGLGDSYLLYNGSFNLASAEGIARDLSITTPKGLEHFGFLTSLSTCEL